MYIVFHERVDCMSKLLLQCCHYGEMLMTAMSHSVVLNTALSDRFATGQ